MFLEELENNQKSPDKTKTSEDGHLDAWSHVPAKQGLESHQPQKARKATGWAPSCNTWLQARPSEAYFTLELV